MFKNNKEHLREDKMNNSLNMGSYRNQNAAKEIKEDKDRDAHIVRTDYVAISIGAFGVWQFIFILLGSSTRSVAAWNTMSVVFLAPKTSFICKSFSDNTTVEVSSNTCYENCLEYGYTNDIFDETIISEFGLICNNAWLESFAQTIMMLGVLCGVSLFGWFSDRYGRSKAMFLSGVTSAIFMFASPFCPNYWTLAAARFLSGIGTGGYFALTVVYTSELVGTRMIDTVLCTFLITFDGIGLPIQAAFAFFTSTWRSFMIVCSSVTLLVVCLTFFLPETPRWLVAKGKKTEAIQLMTRAGKLNKLDISNISENVVRVTEQLNLKDKKDIDLTYLDLFRTKKLTIWTIASVSMWFITGFCYFGLLQYISQFGSNLYVVVTILGIAQIIAAPLSLLVVTLCGRKVSSICIYIAIGILSFALIFTPSDSIVAVILGGLGVTVASISFIVIYIIVIELYPTPMRNMGLSVSSVGSKVAAMVAPFVVNMKTKWIASSIFAAAGFLAVLFCFLLPETKGKKLKDSIDEIR